MNNPLPQSLKEECRKAANIVDHFVRLGPNRGVDSVIPPDILQHARGLAFLTVIKAGFIWSGRAGSGLVVARLPDGTWSAPSAIGTAGAGFGAQIGAEVVDFLLVLNSPAAVRAFTSHNVNLGANVSVAAGPVGRTAEAGGTASRSVAAVFSYSKSKGLFAGISLEGSVIVQRGDANAKFYGRKVSAEELLGGSVRPPPAADVLYNALETRLVAHQFDTFSRPADVDRPEARPSPPPRATTLYGASAPPTAPRPTSSEFARARGSTSAAAPPQHFQMAGAGRPTSSGDPFSSTQHPPPYSVSDNAAGAGPSQPPARLPRPSSSSEKPAPPPALPPRTSDATLVVALYDFAGERPTDLSFRAGDRVRIIRRTASTNDWWEGEFQGRRGSFPANYVESC